MSVENMDRRNWMSTDIAVTDTLSIVVKVPKLSEGVWELFGRQFDFTLQDTDKECYRVERYNYAQSFKVFKASVEERIAITEQLKLSKANRYKEKVTSLLILVIGVGIVVGVFFAATAAHTVHSALETGVGFVGTVGFVLYSKCAYNYSAELYRKRGGGKPNFGIISYFILGPLLAPIRAFHDLKGNLYQKLQDNNKEVLEKACLVIHVFKDHYEKEMDRMNGYANGPEGNTLASTRVIAKKAMFELSLARNYFLHEFEMSLPFTVGAPRPRSSTEESQ